MADLLIPEDSVYKKYYEKYLRVEQLARAKLNKAEAADLSFGLVSQVKTKLYHLNIHRSGLITMLETPWCHWTK
jgi:hypothetical protein